jgi:cyclohexanone monooxygenase
LEKNLADREVDSEPQLDAVVVGAGFAGMYMLHRLRQRGLKVRVFETGHDLGGTWYWNRYPGARCDVESLQYQFGFSDDLVQGWNWSEHYATQPEILEYAAWVAKTLNLRPDIQFNTRVTAATYDEAVGRWTVETDQGDRVSAQFCIMATGCLSASRVPEIPGLNSFAGDWYHTGDWPEEGVDFTGKRTAVIGTGSSGVQLIPLVAEQAERLFVFQRTPTYCMPAANTPLDPKEVEARKASFASDRIRALECRTATLSDANDQSVFSVDEAERQRSFESRWRKGGFAFLGAYNDLVRTLEANKIASDFVREKIRQVVHDPNIAEMLTPKTFPFGTKRPCLGTNYFETFNRPNVSLVDLSKEPITRITPGGLVVGETEYKVDAIAFATGFDAMTGALLRIDIRGIGGRALAEKWAAGPRTYLGLSTAGFPNLFMINGPGSPSVLINMIVAIEHHGDWILACIDHLRSKGLHVIEADTDAEDRWVEKVNQTAAGTLYPLANSWYLGANVPGKPRVFMPYVGGFPAYRQTCDEVVAGGYAGFHKR